MLDLAGREATLLHEEQQDSRTPLTPRQIEILACIALHMKDKEIADRLGIAPNTVKSHVGAVKARLGEEIRAKLPEVGRRLGLIE